MYVVRFFMKKKKICLNCCCAESTYPLDPQGSLYCDIIENYVSPNDSCDKFDIKKPLK